MTGRKPIAVTGAAGFVGRHLVSFLREKDFPVRILLHRSIPEFAPGVEIVQGSITSLPVVRRLVKDCAMVFHLAGALGMRLLSDKDFYHINVEGSRILMEEIRRAGVDKVIHFSSAGVYGKNPGTTPLKESAPLKPVDIYERTKLQGEQVVLKFSDQVNLTIIRPGWVFGEGDRRTFKLIRQINSGWFFIAGSGEKMHSPIHVSDLISGVWKATEQRKSGEVFNLGGQSLSINKICQDIAAGLGTRLLPLRLPVFLVYPLAFTLEKGFKLLHREAPLTRAKLAFFLRGKPIDSRKAIRQLGFGETDTFAGHMQQTIAWYRKNNWLT
jgi:dihydroflavonol-4-reductase